MSEIEGAGASSAAVPSLGSLFDDPVAEPSFVPSRPSTTDRGRLYRSAGAEGAAAAAAIPALPKSPAIDPSLPLSPEAVAAASVVEAAAVESVAVDAVAVAGVAEAVEVGAAEVEAVAVEPIAVESVAVESVAVESVAVESVAVESVAVESVAEPLGEAVALEAIEPAAVPADEWPAPAVEPVAEPTPAPLPALDPEFAAMLAPAVPPVPAHEPAVPDAAVAAVAPDAAAEAPVPVMPVIVTPQPIAAELPPEPTPALGAPISAIVPVIATAAAAPALVMPEAPVTSRATLTWNRGALIIVGATVVAGFAEALLQHSIGTLAGVALVVSTIVVGLLLQPSDVWACVVIPPLAFLATLVTAGQLTLAASGSFLSRQALNIVTGLSLNAPWILGATLVGLVIVLIRRLRSRRSRTPEPSPTDAPPLVSA